MTIVIECNLCDSHYEVQDISSATGDGWAGIEKSDGMEPEYDGYCPMCCDKCSDDKEPNDA